MAQEDVRRIVGHVASLAELLIVMGRVHLLKKGILVVVLISVIIAICLGRGHVVTFAGEGVVRLWSKPIIVYTFFTLVDFSTWGPCIIFVICYLSFLGS